MSHVEIIVESYLWLEAWLTNFIYIQHTATKFNIKLYHSYNTLSTSSLIVLKHRDLMHLKAFIYQILLALIRIHELFSLFIISLLSIKQKIVIKITKLKKILPNKKMQKTLEARILHIS